MSLQRLRYNFLTGTLSSLTGTTITFTSSTGLGTVNIVSGTSYLPLVINPSTYGISNASEIVWVTSYTNNTNTATVLRAQEGTSQPVGGNWGSNTVYSHGTTAQEFGIQNAMTNGDFPTPTASGQVLKAPAAGVGTPVWVSPAVPASSILPGALASGVTISGSSVTGNIAAAQVNGLLNNATIAGSSVTGNIAATQVNGLLNNATISGSAVVTSVANATNAVTASNLGGNINTTQINAGVLPSGVTISGSNINNATITGGTISGVTINGNSIIVSPTMSGTATNNGTITGGTISGVNINNATISGATFSQPLTKLWTYSTDVGALPTGTGGFGTTTVSGYNNYLVTAIANPVFTTSGLTNAISIIASGSQYGQVNFTPPKNIQYGVSTHYAFAAIPSSPVVVYLQLTLNNTTSNTPLTLQIIGMS